MEFYSSSKIPQYTMNYSGNSSQRINYGNLKSQTSPFYNDCSLSNNINPYLYIPSLARGTYMGKKASFSGGGKSYNDCSAAKCK